MADSRELSADDFISRLKEGNLPSEPYSVSEPIYFLGYDEETDTQVEITKPINLGNGRFLSRFDILRVTFKGEFDFGSAIFEEAVHIGGEFESEIKFTMSKFEKFLALSSGHFNGRIDLGEAYFNRLVFYGGDFAQDLNFDKCVARSVSFQKSKFHAVVDLCQSVFIDGISFHIGSVNKLRAGSNPAVGWLYSNEINGVEYSLKDACEMCGHSKPLEGWYLDTYEVMGREHTRWKLHKHLDPNAV